MSAMTDIERAALRLTEEERARLAESLLRSLPAPGEEGTEASEIEEAERRDREIETGQARALSESELWQRVEAERRQ